MNYIGAISTLQRTRSLRLMGDESIYTNVHAKLLIIFKELAKGGSAVFVHGRDSVETRAAAKKCSFCKKPGNSVWLSNKQKSRKGSKNQRKEE